MVPEEAELPVLAELPEPALPEEAAEPCVPDPPEVPACDPVPCPELDPEWELELDAELELELCDCEALLDDESCTAADIDWELCEPALSPPTPRSFMPPTSNPATTAMAATTAMPLPFERF